MSKGKRTRIETSEQIHTHHKRIKNDNGDAQRVDPRRFESNNNGIWGNPTFSFTENDNNNNNKNDPFSLPLPGDDTDDDDDDNNNGMDTMQSRSPSNEANMNNTDDTDFGLLLYELASLDVGNKTDTNNQPQTCPICSVRVSLKEFPDHVHRCLDRMDATDRNDMRSQMERDSDFATAYALKHGYVTEFAAQCPSCGKQLLLGTGINEHVNLCMDEKLKREEMKINDQEYEDEDDDIDGIDNKNNKNTKKVEAMSRDQMIECASKLMTLQQGSQQFDNMLDMFGALGFNKKNVKSVLEIEKKKKQSNDNNNNPFINNNNMNNMNEDNLSPIAEEDVDLFGSNNNNNNNNNNRHRMHKIDDERVEEYTFDDDDL